MEIVKRPRGRPRKKENTLDGWQFGRAAMVMCAYDEVRRKGDKHSVAVRETVDLVKQQNPQMRISETEVKRILAAWRPRGSRAILRFMRSQLSRKDIKPNRSIREQLALLQEKKGLKLEMPPKYDRASSVAVLTIRASARPSYPRHNRKNR